MAGTFARATGKPAFVELHIAPGLGNAGGMLFNAKSAHSPLVVYVGLEPAIGFEPMTCALRIGLPFCRALPHPALARLLQRFPAT
jgi:benzoylformate decarboxylase